MAHEVDNKKANLDLRINEKVKFKKSKKWRYEL